MTGQYRPFPVSLPFPPHFASASSAAGLVAGLNSLRRVVRQGWSQDQGTRRRRDVDEGTRPRTRETEKTRRRPQRLAAKNGCGVSQHYVGLAIVVSSLIVALSRLVPSLVFSSRAVSSLQSSVVSGSSGGSSGSVQQRFLRCRIRSEFALEVSLISPRRLPIVEDFALRTGQYPRVLLRYGVLLLMGNFARLQFYFQQVYYVRSVL